MLNNKLRQLFKKWKLYEREWLFYTTVCYESPLIKIERIYKKDDKEEEHKMHMLLLDLYFEYEYCWNSLSIRQLWELCWVSHPMILNITNKAFDRIRPEIEPRIEKVKQNYYHN